MASEYGWTKDYIFYHVYLDELAQLIEKIDQRKYTEYSAQLAITQNPYVENPDLLRQEFLKHLPIARVEPKFDKAGFELLKAKISGSPRIKVTP